MTPYAVATSLKKQDIPQLSVLVAGTGNVGAEFLRLFSRQQQRLAGGLALKLAGVFNSRQALLAADIAVDNWQAALVTSSSYKLEDLLLYIKALPSPKVLIDITPSQQFARQYPEFIAAGCHIISANKQGVTLPGAEYNAICALQAEKQLNWYSNTTCGAGIPIQRTLKELLNSGDEIKQVSGVFSGTLSWLLCQYDGSKPFSDFVLEAQSLGYTEPDPRDDLSGKDVQRKLLVLARELKLPLELTDISLEPLLPSGLEQGSWEDFWLQRTQLDEQLLSLHQQAKQQGKVLRYAASITLEGDKVRAQVKLVAVALSDPLAALAPCDNIFVIESGWYQQNPLVLKGPGAGREVTAGGLHADLADLTNQVIQQSKGSALILNKAS